MDLAKLAGKVLLSLLLIAGLSVNCANADINWMPDGASISYGQGNPEGLKGGMLGVQWYWNQVWFAQLPVNLTGYWQADAAYWDATNWNGGGAKNIGALGFAPVFRLQTHGPLGNTTIMPYLEASVGLAALTHSQIAYRKLGAAWAFQDLLGAGFAFGQKQQYSLSYHYLHYSNAGIVPPNNGIDVKTFITFAYRFV